MTETYTRSETFTVIHARYLASKVAADLLQMQGFYGRPTDLEIDQYIEELVILVLGGYLDSVDYGFRKDGKWVVVLNYSVVSPSSTSIDDRSGGVCPSANITGADWGSCLRKNSKYNNLIQSEKDKIEQSLPIKRVSCCEPGYQPGRFVSDKNYSNGGVGLERKTFQPY
jgi:hypothetical protein